MPITPIIAAAIAHIGAVAIAADIADTAPKLIIAVRAAPINPTNVVIAPPATAAPEDITLKAADATPKPAKPTIAAERAAANNPSHCTAV